MLLEARSGYSAMPPSSGNVEKVRLASALLPRFMYPAVVLDKFEAEKPFLEDLFLCMELGSHWFLHNADVQFLESWFGCLLLLLECLSWIWIEPLERNRVKSKFCAADGFDGRQEF